RWPHRRPSRTDHRPVSREATARELSQARPPTKSDTVVGRWAERGAEPSTPRGDSEGASRARPGHESDPVVGWRAEERTERGAELSPQSGSAAGCAVCRDPAALSSSAG